METLIILPGWGGNKETWQEFLNFIADNPIKEQLEVKLLELPCFGGEECPDQVWGIEEYSQYVKEYLKEDIDASKVYLLGHSFGGAVAARVCYNNPELIKKLILTAPAIIRPNKPLKRLFFGFISKVGKYLFKIPFVEKFDVWAKKVLYKLINSDYNKTSGIKRDIYKKIIRTDQRNILQDIRTDALVIWGEDDMLLSYSHSKEIVKRLANGTLKSVKNGSHGLHIDHKKELRKYIKNFII